MNNKTLAISILNWNGYSDTVDCIGSLQQSDFQDFDIYLLDNGSNNDEGKKLQERFANIDNITITTLPENIGFTGGNNENLRKIINQNYEFVLLLNNDTIIPEQVLGNLVQKASKKTDGGIFGPIVREYYEKNIVQSCGNTINLWTGGGKRIKQLFSEFTPVDYVSGSCFLISRKTIDIIGLFDNKYFAYWEESDYCQRAKVQGIKTYVINGVDIYHKEESARKKTAPYYTYLMFRNRILFLKKHANLPQKCTSWILLLVYIISIFPYRFGLSQYRYLFLGIYDGVMGKYGKKIF